MVFQVWTGRQRPGRRVPDIRVKMIEQSNAFLTWALAEDRHLPRIPRRRVSEGGFERLMQQPGARDAVNRWWSRTLSMIVGD